MKLTRRRFLAAASTGAAGLALPASLRARVRGANDDIRVAVVGVKSRGVEHVEGFRKLPGVRVVAVCDADQAFLDREVKRAGERKETLATYRDIRKLLESKDVDLVSIATPNHWHALMTLWAIQAGMDVYVEKPASHTIHEGRVMVAAARKSGRIVATGTQNRSVVGAQEAVALARSGELGKMTLVRALCYKRRKSIGKVKEATQPPSTLDYDLWCGPAPKGPLMRDNLHYDWHWVWDTGNGDLGNQGVHQMDIARWAVGEDALPPSVLSIGGRVGYVDDGETPNTHLVLLEYPRVPILFEVRGLPSHTPRPAAGSRPAEKETMDEMLGASIACIIHCEGGNVVIGHGGGNVVLDKQGKEIKKLNAPGNHFANCIDAVRSRKPETLTADVREGHLSSALCHMGNVSHRLGRALGGDELKAQVKDRPALAESFERVRAHLAANGLTLDTTRLTLGAHLKMDPATERFVDNDAANRLATREYRAPFTLPEA